MTAPLTVELTDFLGRTWDLTPGRTGPRPTEGSVRYRTITGLAGAPYSFDELQAATTDGVIVRGRKDEANVIELSCWIDYPRGGLDARDWLIEWRRGLGRGLARDENSPPLRLRINDSRWQDVRLIAPKNEPQLELIMAYGRAADEITVRQDLSWWRGTPVTRSFTAAQFAGATIANRGDEATWPTYRLTGPITSPKLGLDGELVSLPTLTAGQYLDIETDPDSWQVTDQAGNDRSWIGVRWLKQAPARTTAVPVSITGTGTSGATRLDVSLPQMFWMAY